MPIKHLRKQKGRDSEEYRTIRAVANSKKPQMIDIVVNAVARVQDDVPITRLREALRTGNTREANDLINWDQFQDEIELSESIIKEALDSGGQNSVKNLSRTITSELEEGFSFDVDNPRAIEFAQERALELAEQVTIESVDAVRNIIVDAVTEGRSPDASARQIKNSIGLTRRQAQAVDNVRAKAIADGLSQSDAEKRASRKAKQLLDFRAENIARSETLRAANHGQLELGRQIRDDTGRELGKRWIVTDDERLCEICEPLHGVFVRLDEEFSSTNRSGRSFRDIQPPLHPMCRCTTSLEFID